MKEIEVCVCACCCVGLCKMCVNKMDRVDVFETDFDFMSLKDALSLSLFYNHYFCLLFYFF